MNDENQDPKERINEVGQVKRRMRKLKERKDRFKFAGVSKHA